MNATNTEDQSYPLQLEHVIAHAAALIIRWGGIDGTHHKQWVLDQVLRVLMGAKYEEFIALIANWSEGIPP